MWDCWIFQTGKWSHTWSQESKIFTSNCNRRGSAKRGGYLLGLTALNTSFHFCSEWDFPDHRQPSLTLATSIFTPLGTAIGSSSEVRARVLFYLTRPTKVIALDGFSLASSRWLLALWSISCHITQMFFLLLAWPALSRSIATSLQIALEQEGKVSLLLMVATKHLSLQIMWDNVLSLSESHDGAVFPLGLVPEGRLWQEGDQAPGQDFSLCRMSEIM